MTTADIDWKGIRVENSTPSFLQKNEFLIRRLHSLCGLVPVGAYMIVHLTVNSSIAIGPEAFQKFVHQIHLPGPALVFIEWAFIFIPILFHGIFGVMIIRGAVPNTTAYPYTANKRYSAQRISGMLAFFFILWHVFHMHGWFHADWYLEMVRALPGPLQGAQFDPYNAASSAGLALQDKFVMALYVIGVLSCVFHLANGIWTMGITWGVWTSQKAQNRASVLCAFFGVGLAALGLSALFTMHSYGSGEKYEKAQQRENEMYEAGVKAGAVFPDAHKRTSARTSEEHDASEATISNAASGK